MGFVESLYEIDRGVDAIKRAQLSGIQPQNASFMVGNGVGSLVLYFSVSDTILEGSTWCAVKGVIIRIKAGSAPSDVYDGTLVGEFTGEDVISHAIGSDNPVIIGGLTNFTTYYVRLFSYSDHGVYNVSESNVGFGIPKDVLVYGFHQDFLDLHPSTTITYLEEAIGLTPMMTNVTTGEYTEGGWALWGWLRKNLPYMVRKTGVVDYQLDPNDYTKKLDGSSSDISNANYDGGAFAWLPKLYMKEVYAADGNSRDVYFADNNTSTLTLDFYPVGFVDPSNQVMEGVWLPMFYTNVNGSSIANSDTLDQASTAVAYKNAIESFSVRGRFLGGPLLNLLRDVLYMLYRNTNICKYGGYGATYAIVSDDVSNTFVNGRFYGSGASSGGPPLAYNKAFHSSILYSYRYALIDPFTIGKEQYVYVCGNYDYGDLVLEPNPLSQSGFSEVPSSCLLPSYEYVPKKLVASGSGYSGGFAAKLVYLGPKYGSLPKYVEEVNPALEPSSITGLCDRVSYAGVTVTKYISSRLGYINRSDTGPAYINCPVGIPINCACGTLLLPEIGYTPN